MLRSILRTLPAFRVFRVAQSGKLLLEELEITEVDLISYGEVYGIVLLTYEWLVLSQARRVMNAGFKNLIVADIKEKLMGNEIEVADVSNASYPRGGSASSVPMKRMLVSQLTPIAETVRQRTLLEVGRRFYKMKGNDFGHHAGIGVSNRPIAHPPLNPPSL